MHKSATTSLQPTTIQHCIIKRQLYQALLHLPGKKYSPNLVTQYWLHQKQNGVKLLLDLYYSPCACVRSRGTCKKLCSNNRYGGDRYVNHTFCSPLPEVQKKITAAARKVEEDRKKVAKQKRMEESENLMGDRGKWGLFLDWGRLSVWWLFWWPSHSCTLGMTIERYCELSWFSYMIWLVLWFSIW